MLELIDIKEESKVPKYKQIVDSILAAIENGKIKLDDRLPSVNELLIEFDISRDTVVRAYDHLKKNKIIESVPGKGYYVKRDQLALKAKVFLLFNKLSPHKKIIYDAFAKTLGDNATIDFFIYENNYRHFKELILYSKTRSYTYTHYVVISHFEEGGDDVLRFIKKEIPLEKLIVLDKRLDGLPNTVSSIYQDFEQDIYSALVKLNPKLRKYKQLKLLLRKKTYHPIEIKKGFIKFCGQFAYEFGIIEEIESSEIEKETVYINLKENDLVILIKKIKQSKYVLGKDVGIISYNETPLKEVLLDGITVISTDFENLGKKAAEIVLKNQAIYTENPFYVITRNSL
ncbi:winged helix-turn-helix domain-containing protein [Flagellimonas profundi]|uniref:GntR family transcriptional regulator n=1 Tax=Flagellimonas profundi TaxID=2915620 RepID=A0ABS3FBI8_9FLAO|nr:winged helix-turn-helix domain-containing protein [Allomuricauda profundi]MBO0340388.1 GntR family transcriptional regulator [Allomuricauda profundi]